jgi:hypothetical protein
MVWEVTLAYRYWCRLTAAAVRGHANDGSTGREHNRLHQVSLPFGWLGNIAPYPVTSEGQLYPTTEAYFRRCALVTGTYAH